MGAFLAFLAAGAIAIAVWLDARFQRLGPRDLFGALVHIAIALAVGWLLVPAALATAVAVGIPPIIALFTIPFPGLIYMSLAALWLLKHAHALLLRRSPHDAS
jgi:hypothetical protein